MSVCAWRALWQSYRLGRWLRKNPLMPSPRLQGVWQESADRIDRLLRLRDKQVALHEERLQHFLQAIQASPNGVVLLDAEGRILRENTAVTREAFIFSTKLGLIMSRLPHSEYQLPASRPLALPSVSKPSQSRPEPINGLEKAGEMLLLFFRPLAPLAQLAEQLTLNQRVVGSSPTRCTKRTLLAERPFYFAVRGQVVSGTPVCTFRK